MESKVKQRISLSMYFFMAGFGFATWASRIPTLKESFDFNEAELGNLLLVMPVSSLIGLPISGWLVSRFDSRLPLLVAFIGFGLALAFIGYSDNLYVLVGAVFLFAFCMRVLNISMNTQSITLQKSFVKKILGSFHGIWSSGGLLGVGFSTWMISMGISMERHLLIGGIVIILSGIISYSWLLKKDRVTQGNKLALGKPDKFIVYLGLLVFFAAIAEGGMFDWSGVYFKEVVKQDVFTTGYLIFMVFMALSRFLSDKWIDLLGMEKMYIASSTVISLGILMMVIFPYFWPAVVGFSLVGIGVAAIFPMTYGLAGNSKKYSPGMAVSIIATYGIVGMLLGPPLLGYLAHLFNLQVSFLMIMIAGLMLIPISQLFFKHTRKSKE